MNRHFKKYYFYLLARCLCLFGLYDRALPYYSRVIQFRTFFFDVQKQYRRAYEKSSKICDLEIHGGVGDFLQHLPFMLQHPKENYVVITHFPKAREFFDALHIAVKKYHFYSEREEHHKIKSFFRKKEHSYPAPREVFFDRFPFQVMKKNLHQKNGSVTIGLHMTPSAMTSNALSHTFKQKLIQTLLQFKVQIILFGTKKELHDLRDIKNNSIIFASDENIINNLSLVKHCDVLIGADSVFKTMSSMSMIPTILLYEDVKSHFRDRVFINPYVKKKVIYPYKYRLGSMEGENLKITLDFILDILTHNLKLIPTSRSIS